ncbi:MAG: HNH endonuclease signature motif containing protein [Acidimicrobiia bacterium]|nr:MAG: HNH endonuclease signature motif containing protein [Acidimicrobiia bacterium]
MLDVAHEMPFGSGFDTPAELLAQPVFAPIPPGLDDIEPGPALAGWLASINVADVSGFDRIVVLRAHQRMASHYAAHVYRDMTAVTDVMADEAHDPVDAAGAAAAEIRVALHLTRRATDVELSFALGLMRRLPRLAEMLAAGVIDVRRAKTIDRNTLHLPVATAQAVVDQIADVAAELTTGQLAARIQRLCIDVDPDDAKDRYDTAVVDRRVVSDPTTSGTAHLMGMDLPPDRVAAITKRINEIAKHLRGHGESRTMDQLRADIFLDILGGTIHTASYKTAGKAVVDISVDLTTLIQLADHPGELAGYGPVIADIARHVVDDQYDAEWRVTVTNPDTGRPTHTGITTRRPRAAQRRRIEARDRTCVFPGCRMPAIGSDLDHTTSVYDGGPTSDDNLAPLCRNDHCIKHAYGWTYRRLEDGRYEWTTKLGQTYTTVHSARRPP